MTVKLLTDNLRSSSSVAALTVSGVVDAFVAKNTLPVPSSLMVPTPVAATPPGLVANKLKISLLSPNGSLLIAVRTNKPPAGICTKSPGL